MSACGFCRERVASKRHFGIPFCNKCWNKVKGKKIRLMFVDKDRKISFHKIREKLEDAEKRHMITLSDNRSLLLRDGCLYFQSETPMMVTCESKPMGVVK